MAKPVIDPTKSILYLHDVSKLFGIKANTLRQYISRGSMPDPDVRRSPEIGWQAHNIYKWAYQAQRMPADAIPFRYLEALIADGTIPDGPAPRIHAVTTRTKAEIGGGPGVQVHYGGLTAENLTFSLYYPEGFGRITPKTTAANTVIEVTGEVASWGFYVTIIQTHPNFEYAVDRELSTREVAVLAQKPIPYWPEGLRTTFGGIDRRTGNITPVEGATAAPSEQYVARALAVSAFADDPRHKHQTDLITALRATVNDDYRRAEYAAHHSIVTYALRYATDLWTLVDPAKHLRIVATPAVVPGQTEQEIEALVRYPDLLRETSVGDTATARQVAVGFCTIQDANVFTLDDATRAQQVFFEQLEEVPENHATLVHLAFSHPRLDWADPKDVSESPRSYWYEPRSGALAVVFNATESEPAYVRYSMPNIYPDRMNIALFDFENQYQPFIWTKDGQAFPFPHDPRSGYALGYSGTGPQTVKGIVAGLLGIEPTTPVNARWPFFQEGYPLQVTVEEMRRFFSQM